MSSSSRTWLDRFQLENRGTTIATEIRAGIVTFLTMAYILVVNPQILGEAGMPVADVAAATALSAAIATLVMAFFANLPFALAPGMGLNAFFAYSVVLGMGVSWQTALAVVFAEGVLFLVLSLTGLRSRLVAAIPDGLKAAITAGIGLFLAFIGLQNAGLVASHPATLLTLGDLHAPTVLLALAGIVLTAGLMTRRVPGALLLGIGAVAITAWTTGMADAPHAFVTAPALPRTTWFALDLPSLASKAMIPVILAFVFVDLLDTAGTLVGAGRHAGLLDEKGEVLNSNQAFAADAIGTVAGALLGTSTVTTYIESTTGVEEGGRTGLTALTVALLFLSALFFAPLLVAVPVVATAPILVVVGALMMRGAADIPWRAPDEAIPAFLTIAIMPLAFSIADGIAIGLVTWVAIKMISGRHREVSLDLGVVALAVGLLAAWARH